VRGAVARFAITAPLMRLLTAGTPLVSASMAAAIFHEGEGE